MAESNIFTKKCRLREQHNRELIRRMNNGESLTSYDSKASWFPPRPIIAKDKNEMNRIYGSRSSAAEKMLLEADTSNVQVEKCDNKMGLPVQPKIRLLIS